ncbi:hypothetical protein [Neobacillus niacini]|uniref:hypothetical protein n=1 Tax=Neobacillus niacini TaxID=86668 RepID=UPI0021CB11D4|nr:hypothetical protein [Neobacillus niacini]MCM3764547.1 hypothetical protein [Neobacillus niacini]
MTKQEAYSLMVLIEKVYPLFTLTNEIVDYWFRSCGELDYETTRASIQDHIRRSPYPPSFLEISALCKNVTPFSGMDHYVLRK